MLTEKSKKNKLKEETKDLILEVRQTKEELAGAYKILNKLYEHLKWDVDTIEEFENNI